MDIILTEFQNRAKPSGKIVHTTWEDLVERLKNPEITSETLDEYFAMTNEQRTNVKDCGGYVAGEFVDGKRKKDNLKSRYILTIDADEATDHDVEDFEALEDYVFFVHATHTSTPEKPRLRWLFPLSRPVTSEEYRLLVYYMKGLVGADTVDETTDQPERLMFWPSVPLDVDYQFWSGGSVVLDPDKILDEIDIEDIPVATKSKSSSSSSAVSDFEDFDGMLGEGQRNKGVFTFAARLRMSGLEEDEILSHIRLYNDNHCNPILPDSELRTIVHSVCKYPKGEIIPFNFRDSEMDFGDLGKQKKKELAPPLENGNELASRYIAPAVYLVDGMVTTGLGMVVAPPKFGKSWIALDLAISIATGTPFFGKKTVRAGVLYYALEDNDRRVQRRLLQVSGQERKDLSWFYHKEEAPTMDDGLFEEIDAYLQMYPEIKFVVIDTLQKIRPPARKFEGAYSNDYNDAGKIQRFALNRDISILLVHHTRKIIDPNDLIGNISGTNGLSGAIDYAFAMSKKKWDDDQAKLELTGRDIEKQSYMMVFNQASYRWENLGTEKEVRESNAEQEYRNDFVVKTIKYYLAKAEKETTADPVEWAVTPSELIDAVKDRYPSYQEETPIKMGKHLERIQDQLNLDGVYIGKKHLKNKDMKVFSMDRL